MAGAPLGPERPDVCLLDERGGRSRRRRARTPMACVAFETAHGEPPSPVRCPAKGLSLSRHRSQLSDGCGRPQQPPSGLARDEEQAPWSRLLLPTKPAVFGGRLDRRLAAPSDESRQRWCGASRPRRRYRVEHKERGRGAAASRPLPGESRRAPVRRWAHVAPSRSAVGENQLSIPAKARGQRRRLAPLGARRRSASAPGSCSWTAGEATSVSARRSRGFARAVDLQAPARSPSPAS